MLVVRPQPDVVGNVGTPGDVLNEIANDFVKILSGFLRDGAISGERHGFAPSALSIIPHSRISCSLSFTFFLRWCGIRRGDWATGVMDLSI
jgi:hypothetical protein